MERGSKKDQVIFNCGHLVSEMTTADPWTAQIWIFRVSQPWMGSCFWSAIGTHGCRGWPDALFSPLLHRALGYRGFWYPQRSWKQSPIDTSDDWGVTRYTWIFDSVGLSISTPMLFKGQLWTSEFLTWYREPRLSLPSKEQRVWDAERAP